MKVYQFAIVVSIPAESYTDALKQAEDITERFAEVDDINKEIAFYLETNFERDGSEPSQRILYLHNENEPIEM